MTFRVGQRALVAYDGKGGRCMPARIVAIRGCFVRARFHLWTSPRRLAAHWFPRSVKYGEVRYGAFVAVGGWSLMKALGCKGDWYSLHPWAKDLVRRSHSGWRGLKAL